MDRKWERGIRKEWLNVRDGRGDKRGGWGWKKREMMEDRV